MCVCVRLIFSLIYFAFLKNHRVCVSLVRAAARTRDHTHTNQSQIVNSLHTVKEYIAHSLNSFILRSTFHFDSIEMDCVTGTYLVLVILRNRSSS